MSYVVHVYGRYCVIFCARSVRYFMYVGLVKIQGNFLFFKGGCNVEVLVALMSVYGRK